MMEPKRPPRQLIRVNDGNKMGDGLKRRVSIDDARERRHLLTELDAPWVKWLSTDKLTLGWWQLEAVNWTE